MRLSVACVGAGYFSQFHLDSWHRMDGVDLVAVCDRDLEKAAATGAPAYQDLGEMLRATQPDLLDIILPPAAHIQAVSTALDNGVRTIICQKPFCETMAQAEALTEQAQAAGATLIVHENFRFQPWYRAMRQALDRGLLGEVHQMTFRLRPGDGQGPDAYLDRQPYFQTMPRFLIHETGVHYADVFRYLLGDPLWVFADLRRRNPAVLGEDAGTVLFGHPNGAQSILDANRHLDHGAQNLRCTMGEALIEGTKAAMTLDGDGALWLRPFGALVPEPYLPASTATTFGGDCVHELQSHVISALQTGAPVENTASAYLTVLRIEEAIYKSAETGRKIMLEEG